MNIEDVKNDFNEPKNSRVINLVGAFIFLVTALNEYTLYIWGLFLFWIYQWVYYAFIYEEIRYVVKTKKPFFKHVFSQKEIYFGIFIPLATLLYVKFLLGNW